MKMKGIPLMQFSLKCELFLCPVSEVKANGASSFCKFPFGLSYLCLSWWAKSP